MATLMNDLESKRLELNYVQGFTTEASRLREGLVEAWKEMENRFSKLAALKEVKEKITPIKRKVTKTLLSLTMSREYLLVESAQTRQGR